MNGSLYSRIATLALLTTLTLPSLAGVYIVNKVSGESNGTNTVEALPRTQSHAAKLEPRRRNVHTVRYRPGARHVYGLLRHGHHAVPCRRAQRTE